ncbi:hypothetical protein HU200_047837 [Digitaria exilis]|uniref:Uncharacterized protein n=1 Tax=Digitaria exilis TaxID=1010633 RepID=A0A835ECP4_9POAL|nr:hypothetical protein HU200_047837 [Digitaria exilis]
MLLENMETQEARVWKARLPHVLTPAARVQRSAGLESPITRRR